MKKHMMPVQHRRSALYVPASHQRAMEKAGQVGADCIILDLEDAVAPEAKHNARARALEFIRAFSFSKPRVVVRINSLATRWGLDDLAGVATTTPYAVLIPKVNCSDDVIRASKMLDDANAARSVRLWVMLETPQALIHAHTIACASELPESRLECLVLGLNDLSKETSVRFVPGRAPMWHWLSTAVLAARANDLSILDGVFNSLEDPLGLLQECDQTRDFGFDGKTLIHPNQVAIANEAFTPTEEEIAHARAVINAFEDPVNAHVGALRVNGQMVERLHLHSAHRTVSFAELPREK